MSQPLNDRGGSITMGGTFQYMSKLWVKYTVESQFQLTFIAGLMLTNWLRGGFRFSVLEAEKLDRLKTHLIRLFEEESNKRDLSRALKIMPFYFTPTLVEEFSQPEHFSKYREFIATQQVEEQHRSLYKYFKQPQLINISFDKIFKRYMEAYLHWLLNYCSTFKTYINDYMIERLNSENPEKWFEIKGFCQQRTFIYHHGPTNSGKSTAAIEDLKNLPSNHKGIYMAPLRLLAWEYQQKLGNCTLITGQEKEHKNSNLISCTIEAAPMKEEYEVAVIDEIQMLEDPQRGWAWTKAILSIKAKRVHLCGDGRALGIISKLVSITGDVLEERKYSRLSKLILVHKIYKLEDIQPGDCIINFSMNRLIEHRNDMNKMLHQLQKEKEGTMISEVIENQSKDNAAVKTENGLIEKDKDQADVIENKTAIIYGRLPSQCRKSQATSFNDGSLPYLVATNAIGMGLNLNIRKIVFMSIHRRDRDRHELILQQHLIQQIAGRAGRGKETGYVQCASPFILKVVKKALANVNESYGINLENINDSQKDVAAHEEIDEVKPELADQVEVYNDFLKRTLKKKEYQIKKACFFFTNDYIVNFQQSIHSVFGISMSMSNLLKFLTSYTILGEDFFMQQAEQAESISKLIEQYMNDANDIMTFNLGLQLSEANKSLKPELRRVIQHYHIDYVSNFVHHRKVDVPKTIVELYNKNFSNFVYIEQIVEMHYYFNLLESYVWLWNKYDFAFHEIDLAKRIKISLSNKINEVLLNNKFMSKKKAMGAHRYNSFNNRAESRKFGFQKRHGGFKEKEGKTLRQHQYLNEFVKSHDKRQSNAGSQGVKQHRKMKFLENKKEEYARSRGELKNSSKEDVGKLSIEQRGTFNQPSSKKRDFIQSDMQEWDDSIQSQEKLGQNQRKALAKQREIQRLSRIKLKLREKRQKRQESKQSQKKNEKNRNSGFLMGFQKGKLNIPPKKK